MLNILAISDSGEGYGLATKLAKEKNFVKFCANSDTGRGFKLPKRVDNLNPEDEEDVILCLQNTPTIAKGVDGLVGMGRVVIGSGGFLTRMMDLEFREKFMKLIPEKSREGKSYEVYRFFNPIKGYLPFYIVNHPTRRLMDGEHGALYPTTGNVVSIQESFEGEDFEAIEGFLRRVNYTGVVGLVYQGANAEEFIPQLNLGMLYAFSELCLFTFTELFMSLLYELPFTGKFRAGFGVSVLVSLPPFPYVLPQFTPLSNVVEQKNGVEKHFVYEDIFKADDGELFTGTYGLVGWSTAYGVNVREARRRVYRTISNALTNPNLQYRRDIGDKEV